MFSSSYKIGEGIYHHSTSALLGNLSERLRIAQR